MMCILHRIVNNCQSFVALLDRKFGILQKIENQEEEKSKGLVGKGETFWVFLLPSPNCKKLNEAELPLD